MEKVKIKIVQTKNGYDVELEFENDRRMKVPFEFKIPKDYDGAEAMVERKSGQIIRIVVGENEYKKSEIQEESLNISETKEGSSMSYSNNPQSKARAPYNFIPLNEKVVDAEPVPDFNRYYNKDRYSGYIDLELETVTPLYIRRESVSSEFFSIDGKIKIPGSSMRGMIRTIVEIASFGKFKFFNDSRFYFRFLADKYTSLRDYYSGKIKTEKAGYLIFENDRYYIQPAKGFESFSDTSKEFEYKYDEEEKKWKVWSGRVGGRKGKNWKIFEQDTSKSKIELSEEDVEYYINDKNRTLPDGFNILRMAKEENDKFSDGVPIFYSEYKDSNSNNRIAFGHTAFFRLPYEKTVSDHIPEVLRSSDTIDIAEAIFGVEDKFASRVFFEDLELKMGQENIFLPETSPRILSGPKPTTFQHYLKQDESGELKHWDNVDATIRGYKLYWHRNTPDIANEPCSWNEGKIINDKQHAVIKPIGRNVKFSGRVRFENLSGVELGALLFAIELPDKCYHKLGMAKPLGLGSVKIHNVSLYVIKRKDRYSSLFSKSEDSWNLATEKSGGIQEFKGTFGKYVLERIGNEASGTTSLWDTKRMKLLKNMLSWENAENIEWLEKTRYMQIKRENEFRERPILAEPDKFCDKEKSD